jgi:O-antigen/teichoic acid export membrane protein
MLRLLGQSEYGLFKLSSTFTSYLSLISLGLGSAVGRYIIKAKTEKGKEEEEKFFGLFINIFRIISVVSFIVGIVLMFSVPLWYGKSLSDDELSRMKILVFIMVCNTAVNFVQVPYSSVVSSHERFVFIQIMNILITCVAPALNIVVLYMGFASIGMAIASLATTVVTRFAYYFYVKKSIKIIPNYKERPRGVMKEIMVFSFWIFVANVVGQLYNATDTFMIGMIPNLATTGVAVYNVGAVFNSMVFSLTTGISTVISPRTNTMVFDGADNKELTNLAI